MVHTILGKKINDGVYQGRNYHYVSLYCSAAFDVPPSVTYDGVSCEVIKVKQNCDEIYKSIQVGKAYRFYFDKFGNVIDFREDKDK